jgi:hypothetical protein
LALRLHEYKFNANTCKDVRINFGDRKKMSFRLPYFLI